MFRVDFIKYEATLEEFPDEPESYVLIFEHPLQLTSGWLRVTRDEYVNDSRVAQPIFREGDPIAILTDGLWELVSPPLPLYSFSDVVIGWQE